jgi:hypothetical protein
MQQDAQIQYYGFLAAYKKLNDYVTGNGTIHCSYCYPSIVFTSQFSGTKGRKKKQLHLQGCEYYSDSLRVRRKKIT